MYSDEQMIWNQVCNADAKAYNTLYERYWEELFQYAYKIMGNRQDAEELVQDLFVHIWNKRISLPPVQSVKAYLFTAMKHRVLNRLSKRKITILDIDTVEDSGIAESPLAQLEYKESQHVLVTSIHALPAKMKEVFTMHRINNLSVTEIAEQTNTSPQTIRNQLNSAYKKLRLSLKALLFSFF